MASQTEPTAQKTNADTPAINMDSLLTYLKTIKSVIRGSGKTDQFKPEKISASICAAFDSSGLPSDKHKAAIERVVEYVLHHLTLSFDGHSMPSTNDVKEAAASTLIEAGYSQVAHSYLKHRTSKSKQASEHAYGRGLSFKRFFTTEDVHPYNELEWEIRDAAITNEKGKIIFEQKGVEIPRAYSQAATNIIVSKYFRGRLGAPERETSMRQVVDRVAKTITEWGKIGGYFESPKDAEIYEAELTSILINQRAAFNSPVWFNVGVNPRPQCSACFINSVKDDMRSILQLAVTEGMLFKYGSGTGTNLSPLRSSKEHLGDSTGKSSGPVSFMRGYDAFAGVIKSGGKTRRAAKMVILNIDHPDIKEFVWCKAKEEKKAHSLIDAGFDGGINGEAYSSIFFQNANNSVRVTDAFMKVVEEDGEFWTRYILSGEPCEKFRARDLLKEIAEAAWQCGDPGIQYDTTVNNWHTCSNTDRIHASNPCSEYMFLNDSACNLASINLMRCVKNGEFDLETYEHVCRIVITAQEIIVDASSYPTPAIEYNSKIFRALGLGYANLGALLMSMGLSYDSEEGRNLAASLTSIMTGIGYEQSAQIAGRLEPFLGFEKNRGPMLGIIARHRNAAYQIKPAGVPSQILERARTAWDGALARGEQFGYRNAQISVLAPTGTIAFLMDCDTTGVEPDIALVKYKWLVGGGMFKIVNQTVPQALHRLGYLEQEIRDVVDWIDKNDTIEGAPHLRPEHLAIFDCAFKAAKGTRSIHYMGHLRMMAAVQPFISGAISKTVNMPHEATVEDVMNVFMDGWRLGLKAVAIYRDGCKRSQPLTTSRTEVAEKPVIAVADHAPRRRHMPDERRAITHKFQIGPHKGFITVGLYDDGAPGEIFVTISKEGSVLSGLLDVFATSVSIGLQYGVPLKILVNKFAHVRFEPSGFTTNPNIRVAKSIIDYIFRWLGLKFLSPEEQAVIGINVDTAAAIETPIGGELAKDVSDVAAAPLAQPSLLESSPTALSLNLGFDNQSDAPTCDNCGSIMVRNAACYKCLNCGATSGCS